VSLFYYSGHEILKGDPVTYGGNPGEIEVVAATLLGDVEVDYYLEEIGPGVLIKEPKVYGRVFVSTNDLDNELILIARAEPT
jgi:hypothetical protein